MSIVPPRIEADLGAPPRALIEHSVFEEFLAEGCAWIGVDANAVEMRGSRLLKCRFTASRLHRAALIDLQIKSSELSNVDFQDARLDQVALSSCRMTGVICASASIEDAVISECKLDLANFRAAQLKSVRFDRCILKGADFQMAEMKDVSFERCDLEGTDFSRCKLSGLVDFRSSDVRMVRGIDGLKGATIDPVQLVEIAPLLAAHLGLKVD